MMLKTHDSWATHVKCWDAGMFWVNCLFTLVFISECTLKLLALGPRWYFLNWWNLFDFIVVALSIVTLAFDLLTLEYQCVADTTVASKLGAVSYLSVLRVIRLARVFRLIRRAKGLRQMIRTLVVSLPSLVDIFILIGIVMLIFSVLSTTFFYNINSAQDPYGFMDDEFMNYDSFGNTMMLLFRHTTGEAWNGFMYYTSENDSYHACQKAYGEYLNDGCGGGGLGSAAGVGRLIHLTWTVLATYMLMQLFTAVILENFDELARADKAVLPRDKLNEFVDAWTLLDPEAEEQISTLQLEQLIIALSPPLGVKTESVSRVSLLRVIKDLHIPILVGDKISYQDTFKACVRRVLADTDDFEDEDVDGKQEGTHENDAHELEASKHLQPNYILLFRGRPATAAEDYAARSVQLAYREFREKKLQVIKGMRRTTMIQLNSDPSDTRTF